MPPCVAVTGASGFIGTRIVAALIAHGWRVRALTRSRGAAQSLRERGAETVEGGLDDAPALGRLVADAHAVVHCAGAVRGRRYADFERVNVTGARALLAAMGNRRLPLVALSSLAAREPQLSHYARSKQAMEAQLVESSTPSACLILRPPPVYGPGDRELKPLFDAFAHGLAPLPAPPDARVSLLYVDDLAAAITAWLGASERAGGVYEIGDGRVGGYRWEDVVATAETLLGRRIRRWALPRAALAGAARANARLAGWLNYAPMLTPGKVRELRHDDWVCDNGPLTRALGWAPAVGLADGLARTCGWYKPHPEAS